MRNSWLNNIFFTALFVSTGLLCVAQETPVLQPGDQAAFFILNRGKNTIESITWPYQKKIVLLHFWQAGDNQPIFNRNLKTLHNRYRLASYRNAEGFEIIAIGTAPNESEWQAAIAADTIMQFVNGFSVQGLKDPVLVQYGVSHFPFDVLVDEQGKILATNLSFSALENVLDERRNFQPLRKTIGGLLALSSGSTEIAKYSTVYLFNVYGDSLGRTTTSENGIFSFEGVKLNQNLVLKVDNKTDINTSDPIALYTEKGEFLTDGRTRDGGFIFQMSSRMMNRLVRQDSIPVATAATLEEINVTKSLAFTDDGAALTTRDQSELKPILSRLLRDPASQLELVTHTDSRLESKNALELSMKQANAIKTYFQSKGIPPARIRAVAKGNAEPRKICDGTIDCREEDFRMNRRVELFVFKD